MNGRIPCSALVTSGLAVWLGIGGYELRAQQACNSVPAYSPCEMVFELSAQEAAGHSNPYVDVDVQIEFGSPHHHTVLTHAFPDGGRKLVVRVTPTEAGEWDYKVTSNVAEWNGKTGSFTAAASDSFGFIHPANVHHWAYTEKTPTYFERAHLWMGATALDLLSLDDAAFHALADARAAQKFNHLRLRVLGGSGGAGAIVAGQPDPAFFQRLDERIR